MHIIDSEGLDLDDLVTIKYNTVALGCMILDDNYNSQKLDIIYDLIINKTIVFSNCEFKKAFFNNTNKSKKALSYLNAWNDII